MTRGTSYFPSLTAAHRYFAYENATLADIDRKIAEGLIHIGKPPLKADGSERWILVDDGLRYGIEDNQS